MHCDGGHTHVSALFVAVLITLFMLKRFSLLVYFSAVVNSRTIRGRGLIEGAVKSRARSIIFLSPYFSTLTIVVSIRSVVNST